MKSVISHIFS